jgi:putative transposase
MPRPLRIQVPGATYHVTMRGVDSCAIVRDQLDFETLHLLLGITITRRGWNCLSYCFLNTHFHLMLLLRETDLDRGMQYFAGLYARSFNTRYVRTGHLFGERYSSKVVEDDAHQLEVIRYIALNPVRAGACAAPEEWRWNSYNGTAGHVPDDPLISTAETLGLFHDDIATARRELREFVWPAGLNRV